MRLGWLVRVVGSCVAAFMVVALAAFAGSQLRDARAGSAGPTDAAGQAASPSSGPLAADPGADPFEGIPLPRLDQFSLSVAPVALTVQPGATPEFKRVVSEEGGWSLEVPMEWSAVAARLRGGAVSSVSPDSWTGGYTPEDDGIRISVSLWPDIDRRGVRSIADQLARPSMSERQRQSVLIGDDHAEFLFMRETAPMPMNYAYARWFLTHPWFTDRVVQIEVHRAEPDVLAAVRDVVASIELFAPTSGPRGPLLSRAASIARFRETLRSDTTVDRIEAKLVLHKEWELAGTGGRSYVMDPDTPIWVVAGWGDFPALKGGPPPMPPATPRPPARSQWRFWTIDARTGNVFAGGGGTEPAWWSALRDRSADPATGARPSPSALVDHCAGFKQAVLPATPATYPTRTPAEVRAGLATDPYYLHTLEDIAGVRQDSNPLRDQAVPRCAVDEFTLGDLTFVRDYPRPSGIWYVPVLFQGRQVLLATVGRDEHGRGTAGGSRWGTVPAADEATARAALGVPGDVAASLELVFARYQANGPPDQIAWRAVRASGAVFYLFPEYPGAAAPGLIAPEGDVDLGL